MQLNTSLADITAGYPLHYTRDQLFRPGESQFSESTSPGGAGRKSSSTRVALVVDDVADVTEMLSVLLTHAGYEVNTADSAEAALRSAQERHFDIIISDIGMPEMNGYELAAAIRVLPGYESVPMVAVTGYAMFDDRERSLRSGFTAHLTKPIEPRLFLDLIEQL
jgi:CheY-like chemotaxis protein